MLTVFSMAYAQNVELPNHGDQKGYVYFLSPAKVEFFGVTDKGSSEQAKFKLMEQMALKKNKSGVGSMPPDFLSHYASKLSDPGDEGKNEVEIEELHVFADNVSSQNKEKFIFSLL